MEGNHDLINKSRKKKVILNCKALLASQKLS